MVANNGVFSLVREHEDGVDIVGFKANGIEVSVSFYNGCDLVWERTFGRETARQAWRNFRAQGFERGT